MKRRRTAKTCKFQRSTYKRKRCLTLRTQHGASCSAFIEQTLWSDGYGLQVFGNWNQRWSTELCGDRPGRSSRTRTVAISRNVEEPLQQWNIYKMLRNEYKDNFISIGPLIVNICSNAERYYARTSRFFICTHYDNGNDATTYVWVWRMYRRNVRAISPTRYGRC